MTSINSVIRQNSPAYFMPVSSLQGLVYAYNPTDGSNTFTDSTWANFGSLYLSSINGAGAGLLKDLGKQVRSSGRVFRKIQLVVKSSCVPNTGCATTFGVAGTVSPPPKQDFLTGYIELGYEGSGPAAPVVQYGCF